tara:strand:+ start:194 stop:358 length:165 start_codon:yes stop_codon:yes gene_type:complete
MNKNEAWDCLIEHAGVSEDTLKVVTAINGWSLETMESVLYAVTGYRSFDQYLEE